MSEDGQREPGSGGTAHRGLRGAGQARRNAGGESPPGDGQDHVGTPRPDALIPALHEGQLPALREIGREWDRVSANPQVWRRALPVDPSLGEYPEASEVRSALFTRLVPVAGQDGQLPPIQTTSVSETPPTAGRQRDRGGADAQARGATRAVGGRAVLGRLRAPGDAGRPGPGRPARLVVLAAVGAAIAFLMLAVGVSYRQTIRAYPQGGGSYIVASKELGRVLMAAAGLLIDYIMTVAVSIASGLAAITSAYPSMQPATVWIGVSVIVILLAGNLRGVRQAGAMFAIPTYAFIAAIAALVVAGLVHAAGRGFNPVPVRHLATLQAVTVLLVLRAFAAGSTAMTGIEAIANAVPSFKPVEWRNARITLSWMIGLLIGMFAGVLVITRLAGIVPVASQTMLSQLAHLSFGDGPVYVFIQAATAAVLLMAANTSYNDFPRVLFLMARDRQAPRSFLRIGDRLTFRNGILLLSVTSATIYIVFRGNTESPLPLYAVGVFLAFTLSQTVMHWRRHRDQPHWRHSLAFNATGAVLLCTYLLLP